MRKRPLLPLFLLAGLFGLLAIPTTTRQGVDFQITKRRIPLAVKAASFLLRDYEYKRLAAELTHGLGSEESKAEALMRWTHERIRPGPPGWPVVDDHIANIIIRGYGQEDQMADVFVTLMTYAGVPSFWGIIRNPAKPGSWVASFVKIGGHWTVWDVAAGISFRDAQGRLASVEDLRARPELLELSIVKVPKREKLYRILVDGRLSRFHVPDPLRAQMQMPFPRMLVQLRQVAAKLIGKPQETDG